MSQVVNLKRKISIDELREAFLQSDIFSLGSEQDWGYQIYYARNPEVWISFSNGEVETTSPDDELFQGLESLSSLLSAEIILEDEVNFAPNDGAVPQGKVIALYWPLLCIILVVLLVWRW